MNTILSLLTQFCSEHARCSVAKKNIMIFDGGLSVAALEPFLSVELLERC